MGLKDLLSRFTNQRSGPSMRHPADHPDLGLEGLPDFVVPLLGWRAWRLWVPPPGSGTCPAFSSVILGTPWAPRRRFSAEHSFDLGARCRGLLELGCSCGVYAFKDLAEAFIYLTNVRDRLLGMSADVALGTVSLWGKVVECERGYKAQYAYPHHIYLPASLARFVPEISSVFGVAAGIYASTCDKEISLAVFSGLGSRERRKLHLKNSGVLKAQNVPYEVGFYDLTAQPAWRNQLLMARPDFSPPAAGSCEEPGGACPL
jgi:hypothetical protein